MAETLYRKIGRRYEPIGVEWVGFPADGVWYVHDGQQSLIMRVGELPDPMPLAAMERHRDAAEVAMREHYDRVTKESIRYTQDGIVTVTTPSLREMISAFFKAVAVAEGELRLSKHKQPEGVE